ncbi:hypothetical protein DH09_18235 [Bacillaceae bacterium JMAK1]|nr:hypothetical protein DH09_18235 [Bacillaceae bacterium JMAK1]
MEEHHKKRSIFTDPGIILLMVMLALAAFIFIWWPTDIFVGGVSIVAWLLFGSHFILCGLCIIYVVWMEKLEKKSSVHQSKNDDVPL